MKATEIRDLSVDEMNETSFHILFSKKNLTGH